MVCLAAIYWLGGGAVLIWVSISDLISIGMEAKHSRFGKLAVPTAKQERVSMSYSFLNDCPLWGLLWTEQLCLRFKVYVEMDRS